MKTLAVLSLAALMGASTLAPSTAEARGGGAVAAGLIGGFAAGALLGAAVSESHAAPVYGYGYGGPDDGYAYEAPPTVVYRAAGYRHRYEDDAPVYRTRRFDAYDGYGYRPIAHGWHRDCDRSYGGGDW